MPYKIRKSGDKYQVITEGTNKVHGTFPSKEKATQQLKALYVHANPKSEAVVDNKRATEILAKLASK
jgi:hypothetical protein